MSDLLAAVWADLRRTRLAPVAVGLAGLLAAGPLLASRLEGSRAGASQASQPPSRELAKLPPLPRGGAKGGVRAIELGGAAGRNPFRALGALGGASGDGGAPAAGDGPPDGDPGGALAASGGGAAGGSGGAAPTGAAAPLDAPPLVPVERVDSGAEDRRRDEGSRLFAHTVSVSFGQVGRARELDRVERLSLLPSERRPLLVYLGVTPSRRTAVFMVESRLEHAGEGRCRPSPRVCTFLHLRADTDHDEHFFRAQNGRRYRLRLLRIERRPVDAEREASAPGAPEPPPVLVDEAP